MRATERFRATALAHLEDMDAPDEEGERWMWNDLAALMASGELQDSFTAHKRFKAGTGSCLPRNR